MHTAYRSPAITLTAQPSADLHTDLLVIPVFTDDDFSDEGTLDAASGGEISRARSRGELTGKPYDVLAISTLRVSRMGRWPRPRYTSGHDGPRDEEGELP